MKTDAQLPEIKRPLRWRYDAREPSLVRNSFAEAMGGKTTHGVLSDSSSTLNLRGATGSQMHSEEIPSDPAFAAHSGTANASQAALTAQNTWVHIDAALSPIVGTRGVAGLFKRSLALTRTCHPLLAEVYEGPLAPGDYEPLRRALAENSVAGATAANIALLETFNDLLTRLIGPSLTERLLQPVLDNPLSRGDAVQDTSP